MTTRPDSIGVRCPTCGAAPGVPCTVKRARLGGSATTAGSVGRREHERRFVRYFRTLDRRARGQR